MAARTKSRLVPIAALCLLACAVGEVCAADDEGSILRATQETFRSVVSRLRPSLVRIETVGGTQPLSRILPDPDEDPSEGQPRSGPNVFLRLQPAKGNRRTSPKPE